MERSFLHAFELKVHSEAHFAQFLTLHVVVACLNFEHFLHEFPWALEKKTDAVLISEASKLRDRLTEALPKIKPEPMKLKKKNFAF